MYSFLHPLARILTAFIFIMSGISKITGYAKTGDMMSSAGLPFVEVLLPLAIIAELGGGLALLFGFKTRLAALALLLFLIPTTLIFHAAHIFDPVEGQNQLIQVMKNLAIMGGLIKFIADGAGAYSIDESTGRAVRYRG